MFSAVGLEGRGTEKAAMDVFGGMRFENASAGCVSN